MKIAVMPAFSRLATVFSVLLAAAAPARAQSEGESPQATTATYSDWTLRCEYLPPPADRRICEVAQSLSLGEEPGIVAQVVMGRAVPDKPVILLIQLAQGVWLPGNVTLTAASGEAVTARFTRCIQLCIAEAEMPEAMLAVLSAATEPARLSFQDGAGRLIDVPVPLKGFGAAHKAAETP